MKRFVAFTLMLVLALTLCATAFAAKPTATVLARYKNQYVSRGGRLHFEYKVDSKSYSAIRTRYGYNTSLAFRAAVRAVNSRNGRVCSTEQQCFFTGRLNTDYRYFNWTVGYNAPKGRYYNHYATYYRTSKTSCVWYKVKEKKTAFYVY